MRQFIFLNLILILSACSDKKESLQSDKNSDESHNSGKNCISCHIDGGPTGKAFFVAGTVYTNDLITINPNATVIFSSEPNGDGSILAEIEVDKKGNFYTTNSFNILSAYPGVVNNDGEKIYMSTPIPNGQCNSCHGVITSKIFTN